MKNTVLLISMFLSLLSTAVHAQNWDEICNSAKYYYGVGYGTTVKEATDNAVAEISSSIARTVSSDFRHISEETNSNGELSHESKVSSLIQSYSQATLTNVEKWIVSDKEPGCVVRCWIERSEISRIFEGRIKRAKDMLLIADDALSKNKIDMALQYYYWSYSLLCSVQFPNEVIGENGEVLVERIPVKIMEILDNVSVKYEKRDGDYVDLLFFYKGNPVSSLEFTYNDGRVDGCIGDAKDGRGAIEMIPGFQGKVFHINIEYEFKGQAEGDPEMQSVLGIVNKRYFKQAAKVVDGRDATVADEKTNGGKDAVSSVSTASTGMAVDHEITYGKDPLSLSAGMRLTPDVSQLATGNDLYRKNFDKILSAVQSGNYSAVTSLSYFTIDGLDVFKRLIRYGRGRVVGIPNVHFFKGADGIVVARGLQMSFSFGGKSKNTFVEDVVFTFTTDGKIDNVSFGLGSIATNDILCKEAPEWSNEAREQLMEFLENYKTAYSLERLEYLRDIFSDDAVIIVGNVTRRMTNVNSEIGISIKGQEIIRYNRYTKDTYISHLDQVFRRNEFINIRFTNNDVQKLTKFADKELYAIQIGQEYKSSLYADMGYLFLLVDMTNPKEPIIKVRTWQPNEVDPDSLYHIGDFYR
ncbi:MAG: LPP20 family lipoprotein [Bacteroidaceae bacterium]|nr:LPP20 family lipoprotein [Bacteroidaceae bacterium]